MGNTCHMCGTMHRMMNPLAMATLSDWNSIVHLNGWKSLDRITALRSISSIGVLLDSNLLIRSIYPSIGLHTNRLVHCGMGHEIVLCVCVFSDFVMWGEFYILHPLVFEIFIFALKFFKIISCDLRFFEIRLSAHFFFLKFLLFVPLSFASVRLFLALIFFFLHFLHMLMCYNFNFPL